MEEQLADQIRLRPAQREILQYEGGRMAVSAVPGSGKTFTLSLLAANLIADGRIDVAAGQQVLIVTYLNASVETFKAGVRRHLLVMERPLMGFDVRTLHSLGLEIVRTAAGSEGEDNELVVLDESQANHFLELAVTGWIDAHPSEWAAFLPDAESLRLRTRWREITERTARDFIRTAKNERLPPHLIAARVAQRLEGYARSGDFETTTTPHLPDLPEERPNLALVWMLNGIYQRYQEILARQAALDFDDLIWEAVDLLETRPELATTFRERWPYVLEDEAQDSVPLQEALLAALTGEGGNWVRVGDPNQAITSTFTAAHPRHFNEFIDRPDVVDRALPNSGRSAPRIFGAANAMLHWVMDHHPVPEVREHTFRRQDILPTPPGDAQPNPQDSEQNIRIKVYQHREDEELPAIAQLAWRYAKARPEQTLAILVPTNNIGYQMADHLDALDADYDNLLRGGTREREVAAAMHALLSLLADPLDRHALVAAHESLALLGHPAAGPIPTVVDGGEQATDQSPPELKHFHTLLRSVHRPELLLFPEEEGDEEGGLPAGVATDTDRERLQLFMLFLRRVFQLRSLPIDDLALALGDELFARPILGEEGQTHEFDLSVAYQIAGLMRRWRDLEPEWRLPQLVEQLADIASGRRSLPGSSPGEFGFEPTSGRITLATQHGAKGLEWDAVFLVGIDNFWIPGTLDAPFLGVQEFLGGDPAAEAIAQLRHLMEEDAGLHAGRSATESLHIEVISERLRLLYVGITRARRYLHISRSRATRRYHQERRAEPATVLGVLYRFLKEQ